MWWNCFVDLTHSGCLPEPEKCFNCRQEGHSSSEPGLCRKCRKPVSRFLRNDRVLQCCLLRATSGMTVPSLTSATTAERRVTRLPTAQSRPSAGKKVTRLPTVQIQCAAACGEDCANEERTYTFTNEEGETKEMYCAQGKRWEHHWTCNWTGSTIDAVFVRVWHLQQLTGQNWVNALFFSFLNLSFPGYRASSLQQLRTSKKKKKKFRSSGSVTHLYPPPRLLFTLF